MSTREQLKHEFERLEARISDRVALDSDYRRNLKELDTAINMQATRVGLALAEMMAEKGEQ